MLQKERFVKALETSLMWFHIVNKTGYLITLADERDDDKQGA